MANYTNNKRIQVSELDFDAIKTNIKTYLKGQSEFTDFDFEGSAMSVLIDLLAYNTHYNGVYTNLAVNEMFLDSASKRSSVVSLAKMLGYTPISAKCSKAVVTLTVSGADPTATTATLFANQPFSASKDNKTFIFQNKSSMTVTRSASGNFVFPNIEIIEGANLQNKYIVQDGQRFIIPNQNVDLSSLSVKVYPNVSSNLYKVFTVSTNIVDAASDTNVYFIKEIEGGLYEIQFGDGVIGSNLENGNLVTLDYTISSLDEPNMCKAFTYGGTEIQNGTVSTTTIQVASGGSSPEDLDSIKFHAPRTYAAQNRAVTPDDYAAIIYTNFPEAQTVSVWGGEDNNPPVYGKTYICIKPKDANKLTALQKEYITNNVLKSRNIVSITPEILDPEYFNIKVTSVIHYDERKTTKTALEIAQIVKNAILNYNDTELQKFSSVLRYSKLVRIIDEADPAIVNNITRLMVRHPHEPIYNISTEYKLDLINPISQDGGKQGLVFSTTGFYIPNSTEVHYLDDDSVGNIRLYYVNANQEKVFVNRNMGTIDYSKGSVVVRNLTITSLDGPVFEWQVKPESYDIVSALNQIVQIDPSLFDVTAIPDPTINGDMEAGYNYQFTSIRS